MQVDGLKIYDTLASNTGNFSRVIHKYQNHNEKITMCCVMP